jgi:uncharacterized metal-binding protein
MKHLESLFVGTVSIIFFILLFCVAVAVNGVLLVLWNMFLEWMSFNHPIVCLVTVVVLFFAVAYYLGRKIMKS